MCHRALEPTRESGVLPSSRVRVPSENPLSAEACCPPLGAPEGSAVI